MALRLNAGGKNSATLRQIAGEIFPMRFLVGQRDCAPFGKHQTCLLTSSTVLAAFVTAPEGMKKNELSTTTYTNKVAQRAQKSC